MIFIFKCNAINDHRETVVKGFDNEIRLIEFDKLQTVARTAVTEMNLVLLVSKFASY